ncbi:glycosyltransferase family 2 protein [Phycomyces blakesleeanus]|uniref:Glycosyltransferase family 2 protein n=1 Tax=Phycomyces blakesleeanus TaxID=4837 RepID=A0ABR3B0W2_PHYBL
MLYLTDDVGLLPFFLPFGIIGFYRYLWYFIKLVAWLVYKPRRPKENPTYDPERDVTIIVPTIDAGEEFKIAARSWLACKPKEIIIITETKMLGPLQELANEVDPTKIKVLTVSKANKRLQMVAGVNATQSEIIVFADDDAIWKPTMLEYILACFEDLKMGGVGTSQTVHAVDPNGHQTVWEILAGYRLTSRNIEIASSTHIDGGVCCLSGRTAAYRTLILKDPAFQHCFTNDLWLGKYPLNSGDDKFLTRWMVSHGWNTYAQLFNPLTLLAGPILVGVFASIQKNKEDRTSEPLPGWNIAISYIIWLLVTRAIKLGPHFIRRPLDIWALPAWLLFNYYFAIMKIYALFTLHEVGWGTRAGIGNELAADIGKQDIQIAADAADATQNPNGRNTKIEMSSVGNEPPQNRPGVYIAPPVHDPFWSEDDYRTEMGTDGALPPHTQLLQGQERR